MIKLGYVSTHQEDLDFLFSEEISTLLRDKNCCIESALIPAGESSADVLLVSADMLNRLPSMYNTEIWTWIFISSNKADALHAWQMGAVYFLLRPFSVRDFKIALDRAQQSYFWKKQILPSGAQFHTTLELQLTKGRRLSVSSRDILFLEAQGEVTCVHLVYPGQEKVVASRNLGYWEQQLGDTEFIRVHKKYLVNIAHISSLQSDELWVQQHLLPVAKRRKKEVDKAFFAQKMLRQAT